MADMQNYKYDSSLNLDCNYDRTIESAYVITIKDDKTSEAMTGRCITSCNAVGQPVKVWDAFNGRGDRIITPEHSKNQSWTKWFKVFDHHLSQGEIACYLSHLSLWIHCIEIDRPIVILEHDAIMLHPYLDFKAFNNIVYLGSSEQYKNSSSWPVTPIPMFSSINRNYMFIGRAHAYAVDPQVCKNIVGDVIKNGLGETLDIVLRADRYGMVQQGLYAYNEDGPTTIDTRKPDVPLDSISTPEMSKYPGLHTCR